MSQISERLSQLEVRLQASDFLRGAGLGNEVNFHIFDYEPQLEPLVSAHIERLKSNLAEADIRVLHLDLYDLVLAELRSRNYLERCFALEASQGWAKLYKELGNLVRAQKIVERIAEARVSAHDLVFLTGVGQVFPLLRSHTVLNQLHSLISEPLVMFFPGSYNGDRLELFGAFADDNYYRAFRI